MTQRSQQSHDTERNSINNLVFIQKCLYFTFFFKILFIFREGREEQRERNISVWMPLEHPLLEICPQPRHVPWLGIKLVTLWLAGWCSIHWATSARATFVFKNSFTDIQFTYLLHLKCRIHLFVTLYCIPNYTGMFIRLCNN